MTDFPPDIIEDLAGRVGNLESSLGEVMQKVDDHEGRLNAFEKEREWMLAVLLRVLDGVGEVKQRTTVITQRSESLDSMLNAIVSRLDAVQKTAQDVVALGEKLDRRPCLIRCPED